MENRAHRLVVVALSAGLGVLAVTWWLLDRPLGVDSAVYRAAGSAVLHGEPLYGHLTALPGWAQDLPFTYPPFAALLFTVGTVLPWQLWWGVLAVAAPPAVFLVLRAFRARRSLVLLLGACCLQPVWQSVGLGQLNLVLMALVVLDVLVLRGSRYCGIAIGLAAAIKLIPLVFIVHLLVTGRRADAMRALATFAGASALALLVLPGDTVQYLATGMFNDHFAAGKAWAGNQSWQGFLARTVPDGWALPLTALFVAACVAATAFLVRWLHRSGDARGALLVTAGCSVLVSPISWTHHWVWIVPALAYLLARGLRWQAAAVATVYTGWTMAVVPGGGGRERGWTFAQVLVGNAYLLSALLAGALLLRKALRERAASASRVGSPGAE
ncbi:glycosyltransferase 87 family protein [Amycolatopsis sp. CA-230715]|uniref:glycosyltransferase 87 family protein n=1 Tax=Amycolatopsis sp. CA-230715 TaxID=2745196 RepID=UPI001C00C668|nr:glycosyltransferase 87 family protein [Amycolatopsis sp. CA-230715]QWF83074.1 Polyprenol-phosphate-mannose-dependent alpha-(1-2)-phosphatidylinositol mannoside mannosyltransferase [Amycolatopsis sp. CA-230715]